jgi:hypothetical protein
LLVNPNPRHVGLPLVVSSVMECLLVGLGLALPVLPPHPIHGGSLPRVVPVKGRAAVACDGVVRG